MTRRTLATLVSLVALLGAALFWVHPVGATRAHAIDPTQLSLPLSVFPPGTTFDHNAVSPNADANGAASPDGFNSQLRILHQTSYDALGRISGWRTDVRYQLQGADVGTEYLVSVFATPEAARAAMNDAIGPGSLLSLIGSPITPGCTVGDQCKEYSGPEPGTSNKAVVAIFTEGPILVETASHVPGDQFDKLLVSLQTALNAIMNAADARAKAAISAGAGPTGTTGTTVTAGTTATVAPTATTAPTATVAPTATPTATATATKTPKKKCPKNAVLKKNKCVCKSGYTKDKNGKCVKKK